MMLNALLSYLESLNWGSSVQWYLNHLDVGYLLLTSHHGKAFTMDDWLSTLLVLLNMLIVLYLIHLFIKEHKQKNSPPENMDNNLPPRQPPAPPAPPAPRATRKPVQTKLEAKVSDSPNLKQAYNLHRLAMYDHALDKFKVAFHADPHELNTYLVGLKIISEMEEPNKPFVQFLKDGISALREKHPDIWSEVARYGREVAPSLDHWQPA